VATVAKALPAAIFYQNSGSTSNPIDHADQCFSFMSKCNALAGADIEFLGRSLLLRDQLMAMLGVGE
jgi:hypothetical protein